MFGQHCTKCSVRRQVKFLIILEFWNKLSSSDWCEHGPERWGRRADSLGRRRRGCMYPLCGRTIICPFIHIRSCQFVVNFFLVLSAFSAVNPFLMALALSILRFSHFSFFENFPAGPPAVNRIERRVTMAPSRK